VTTPPPPVTFDFPTWTTLFPEFSPLSPALGAAYFAMATSSVIANTVTNPMFFDATPLAIPNLTVDTFTYDVYLATSHVAWLFCPKDATGAPSSDASAAASPGGMVGRISQATEGSVSVSTEYPMSPDASALEKNLSQTKYGQQLWTAMKPYRTAQYMAQPVFVLGGRFRNPYFPVFPPGPWY